MATLAEKIMLSLDVYEDASQLPPGWTRVAQRDDSGSGFFAAAYRKGSEVVVTFRGWNDAEPTDAVDVLRAYENGPFEQIGDAQRFFDSVKAANPGATFSFTGHSLGGGLAAAMAVRNNLLATSFAAIEMVDAVRESMSGHKEKFLGITLWEIAAAAFNTAITSAQLSNYAGVQNYTVFGDIAHYNDRASPAADFIGADTVLLPGLAAQIYEDDSQFGRWAGNTGDIWSSLVPVDTAGTPFSVDFAAQLHSLGFTALPLLFASDMASLTAALPRLVLQLTNDYLARDSDGIIPWRMTYDALDAMVLDHLKTPPGQATVLSAMMGDLHDIANGGPNGSAAADREINTGILQLAIEHAARETLDDNAVPNTAGLITDHGVYISASLGRGPGATPEGTKVLVAYASSLSGDAAGQGGTTILNGAGRVLIESNDGAASAFNGLWTSNELIFGGRGNDAINAFAGNDAIFGLGGRDRLWGHAGNDLLSGGADADFLAGGPGGDILIGGALNDRLYGEAGRDLFVFDTLTNGPGGDLIADFVAVDDTLAFDNAAFTVLASGALAAAALAFGGAATAAAHRFVYNTTNGVLLYDADGSGATAAIRIATLTSVPVLTAADFLVI